MEPESKLVSSCVSSRDVLRGILDHLNILEVSLFLSVTGLDVHCGEKTVQGYLSIEREVPEIASWCRKMKEQSATSALMGEDLGTLHSHLDDPVGSYGMWKDTYTVELATIHPGWMKERFSFVGMEFMQGHEIRRDCSMTPVSMITNDWRTAIDMTGSHLGTDITGCMNMSCVLIPPLLEDQENLSIQFNDTLLCEAKHSSDLVKVVCPVCSHLPIAPGPVERFLGYPEEGHLMRYPAGAMILEIGSDILDDIPKPIMNPFPEGKLEHMDFQHLAWGYDRIPGRLSYIPGKRVCNCVYTPEDCRPSQQEIEKFEYAIDGLWEDSSNPVSRQPHKLPMNLGDIPNYIFESLKVNITPSRYSLSTRQRRRLGLPGLEMPDPVGHLVDRVHDE